MMDFLKNNIELPDRSTVTNKGDAGRVLVVGSDIGMCGAAAFCALSAYRMGCGLVDVYTHIENRIPMHTLVPEAVLSFWQNDDESFTTLKKLLDRADAVVLGVGFGIGDFNRKIFSAVIELCRKHLVIDADGLNILAKERALLSHLPENTVLTPHLLELARLAQVDVSEVKKDTSDVLKNTFENVRVAVAAKSDKTVILLPNKEILFVHSGDSSLSTGGTGDILAGMTASLIAQKMPVEKALPTAVFLHGEAGKKAGQRLGVRSVIARDVIETLPDVLKEY